MPERIPPGSDPASRLEDYLDGLLTPGERAAFEAALRDRPDLRAQVKAQGMIDASIRRIAAREPAVATVPARRARGPRRYAAAAGIVLAVAAALWFIVPHVIETPVESLYRATLAGGFQPQMACTTDEQFRAWVWQNYRQGLAPAPDHPGVEFVGWTYSDILGPYSGVLLARASGREVLVLLQRVERVEGHEPMGPIFSGLHMRSRDVGKLRLYELSRGGGTGVLDVLREVPPPAAP